MVYGSGILIFCQASLAAKISRHIFTAATKQNATHHDPSISWMQRMGYSVEVSYKEIITLFRNTVEAWRNGENYGFI